MISERPNKQKGIISNMVFCTKDKWHIRFIFLLHVIDLYILNSNIPIENVINLITGCMYTMSFILSSGIRKIA